MIMPAVSQIGRGRKEMVSEKVPIRGDVLTHFYKRVVGPFKLPLGRVFGNRIAFAAGHVPGHLHHEKL